MPSSSAFASLDAPPSPISRIGAGRAKYLPRYCGTYAFYDAAGDLLYLGKAKNVRTRVLSHRRPAPSSPLLLRPWTHLITEIEVRPAASETEALLVEADLVGRLRPPFNRQMRSWSRYCYLVPTGDPSMPLSVSGELQRWKTCFGPYRSRHQAVRIVEAVFRTVSRQDNAAVLNRCHDVFAGNDDALVVELEAEAETAAAKAAVDPWNIHLPQVATILRAAFERARLLRDARTLLGAIIVLPGSGSTRTAAVITRHGLHLAHVGVSMAGVAQFLVRYREWLAADPDGSAAGLPKDIADSLCVAARQVRQRGRAIGAVDATAAAGLSAGDFLAVLDGRGIGRRAGIAVIRRAGWPS